MRVVVDGRSAQYPFSGVGVIASKLVEEFLNHADGDIEYHIAIDEEAPPLDSPSGPVHRLPRARFLSHGVPALARRLRADTVFVPRQTVPIRRDLHRSFLMHDVGFWRAKDVYPRNRRIRLTTRIGLSVGQAFSVSEFTADEVAHLGFRRPIPLPIGAIHSLRNSQPIKSKYVLCVAQELPHKNLLRLVEAWVLVRSAGMTLIICGKRGSSSTELEAAVRAAPAESVVILRDLPDDKYQDLLAGAYAYVQPSFYEGLGIPLLDAASAGIPSISSSDGNGGAVFASSPFGQVFEPSSVADMADRLDRIVNDGSLRRAVSSWQRANVQLTDWSAVRDVLEESWRNC